MTDKPRIITDIKILELSYGQLSEDRQPTVGEWEEVDGE